MYGVHYTVHNMASQRPQLSRERILEAAGRVVAKDGLESLSMRRLAQELDVWPMSVYRHFRDKEELLDALVESAAAQVELPAAGGDWRHRMRVLLEGARVALGGLPTLGPLRLSEAGLAILRDAGFSAAEAASAWRVLWSYAAGFAVPDEEAVRELRSAIAGLREEDHPALAWAGDALVNTLAGDEEFARGLERLMDGLAPVHTEPR